METGRGPRKFHNSRPRDEKKGRGGGKRELTRTEESSAVQLGQHDRKRTFLTL